MPNRLFNLTTIFQSSNLPISNARPSELISIIVPVYNEAGTVRQVIDRLLQIPLPAAREIIVVNDGSTDGTREVLDGIAPVDGVLSIVHAAANGGKGSAHPHRARACARHDRRHSGRRPRARSGAAWRPRAADPRRRGRRGVRLALSDRAAAGPWVSVAANRGLTWLTNVLFGGRLTDMETCYKIMAAPVARSLQLESNRFDIEPEITAKLLRQRLPHRRAPVTFDPRNRASGKKIGWRDGVHAIAVLLKYRFSGSSNRCFRGSGEIRPTENRNRTSLLSILISCSDRRLRALRSLLPRSGFAAARMRPADPIRRATR